MQTKRVIIGDKEVSIPVLGIFPMIGIGLVFWLLTGTYVVGPDEVGVVQTFGKHTSITQSGLNYHWPYPIETVQTPKVTEVKRVEIGFRTMGNNQYRAIEKESLMLTGDENIVELRTVIGKHKIDEALTSGKFLIQEETKDLLQSILDKYGSGILVVAVQLQDVSPPKQVRAAFKDVASAKEDKNRMINQAEGYRNDIIPKARGEAQAMISEAEGFREARVSRAEGEVARFNAMLVEYKKAKVVTRTRLYLETMEEILPNINKYIIPGGDGGNLLNLLNLNNKGGN